MSRGIFGKIEYLNLIIFDIFLKKSNASSAFKMAANRAISYPARLNYDFLFRRIEAGFISSITRANDLSNLGLGIIANRQVWSVLLLHKKKKNDYQSATSNALSKILEAKGEVLIGDRALKFFYNFWVDSMESKNFSDLCDLWYKKTGLPFVFGRLCFNKNYRFYNNLVESFRAKIGSGKKFKGIKVPYFIIERRANELGISKLFAKKYLENIYYKIDSKERVALFRFYRLVRLKGIKKPKRF